MRLRKWIALMLALLMMLALAGCGGEKAPAADADQPTADAAQDAAPADEDKDDASDADASDVLAETTVYVDIAASLGPVFQGVLLPAYAEKQPNVTVALNIKGSGDLLIDIEESGGVDHDIFFSAGAKQVKTLDETDGMVVEGSIVNLLSNELCLVTGVGSETAVTGWDNLADAKNMALCAGTVPVGKYTRIALVNLGYLAEADDPSAYTRDEVSDALNGLEINECSDVAATAAAVAEHSNEVGTVYYSDYYNYKDELEIIAKDDGTLTGPITYPICQVKNPEADEAELAATADFLAFLQSAEAQAAFEEYCFVMYSK